MWFWTWLWGSIGSILGIGLIILAIILFLTDLAKDLALLALAIAGVALYFHFFGGS